MKKILLIIALFSVAFSTKADDLSDWNPTYTIDFFAAFDPSGASWAINKCGSLEAYGEHVVKSMNTVMHNSKLDAKFRLVGTYTTAENVAEVVKGPGYCLNNRDLREAVKTAKADITLLFIAAENSIRPESGNAFFMAKPGDGYGCVHVTSGYETLTAIHESAHIMGCAHARDVDVNNEHPYNAGAMRWIDGVQYSTVMGYHGILLPYFSSPSFIYKGTVMGSESENCCRMITERLPEIVRLGDTRLTYELGRDLWVADSRIQSIDVSLNGNKAYKIKSDAEWLDVTPTQGWLEEPFTIALKYNGTGSLRTGHVTVSDWDADNPEYTRDDILGSATVTVIQLPEQGLLMMPEEWTAPYYGETTELKIYTSSSFMIEDNLPEWLTLSKMYGNGNTTLTATVSENMDRENRTATITIHHDGKTEKYPIKQEGQNTVCIGALRPAAEISSQSDVRKVLKEHRLLIEKGGKTYTVSGLEVK